MTVLDFAADHPWFSFLIIFLTYLFLEGVISRICWAVKKNNLLK